MSSKCFPAASLRSQPDCSAPIAPRMTQLGNGSVSHEQQRLALRHRGVRRGTAPRISAFDRAARRPVAMDDFDDTEPTRVGRRDRQHRLLRGSQFVCLGWLARAQTDRTGRRCGAHAQQRRREQTPCRLPLPARRSHLRLAVQPARLLRVPANHAPRPLSPSAAPGSAASSIIRLPHLLAQGLKLLAAAPR